MANDVEALRRDWETTYPLALKFAEELDQQFTKLLGDRKIAMGVPVQKRVKTWGSLEEKLGRKSLNLTGVRDLHDFVGLRIILLFRRDVEVVCELLNQNLRVIEQYDAADRLQENQFGYASTHVILTLPDAWLQVPTFAPLKGLVAEVQVRTAAQHAWAAASHVLQYKAEASVPPSVRRSINRVSALLETVDLEFERVLDERQKYREIAMDAAAIEPLNVDLVEGILDSMLPEQNRVDEEDYDGLFTDLTKFDVANSQQLRELIEKHKETVLTADRSIAQRMSQSGDSLGPLERQRATSGIWFSHTGLMRELMRQEFGEKWTAYKEGGSGTRRLISTRLGKA